MTIIDTGIKFMGHPILLGPSQYGAADKLTLTSLDRFLKETFPDHLVNLLLRGDGNIVEGAVVRG